MTGRGRCVEANPGLATSTPLQFELVEFTTSGSKSEGVTGLRILVLGPMEIVSGDARTRLGPQQAALLAALLTDLGRAIPSRRLVDLLWDGDPSASATVTLRSHVSHLRRALTPASRTDTRQLLTSVGRGPGAGYLLDVEPDTVDAAEFEALYFRAVRSMAAGDPYPCVDVLDTALALWRGAAFADVAERPFMVAEVVRLNDLADSARRLRAEALASLGRGAEALGDLRTLLAGSPLDESLRTTLAKTLYGLGRVDEAAALCREGIELLGARGLDAPEFTRLQCQILRRQLAMPGDPPPTADAPRRATPVPRQLPSDLPRFVGRDEHLELAAERLTDQASGSGLLVVSGQPGIGAGGTARASARPTVSGRAALRGSRRCRHGPSGADGRAGRIPACVGHAGRRDAGAAGGADPGVPVGGR